MKRILAIILASIMMFGSVAFAQTSQTSTSNPTGNTTVASDPLPGLIARETNTAIRTRLHTIATNRNIIIGLRATTTLKIGHLTSTIALLSVVDDDDNEALDKARDIVEDFNDIVESGLEHDAMLASKIVRLQRFMQEKQNNAANVANREEKRLGRGNNRQDDDELKNSSGKQNINQNHRIRRNETAILRHIDNIIRQQQRIINRLRRRITLIENLIEELS